MATASLETRRHETQRTQSIFREINDRVAELSRHWEASPARFICECLRIDCGATIPLSLADYARVRSDPACFIVIAGHEDEEIECVGERRSGCVIVRKADA